MSKGMKQAAESATKKEPSSSLTPSPSAETGDKPSGKPTKLTVPHSVQFLQPTEVKPISPGASYLQVSRQQCRIIEYPWGVMLEPLDPRSKFTTKVYSSAIKALTYETIDASELV